MTTVEQLDCLLMVGYNAILLFGFISVVMQRDNIREEYWLHRFEYRTLQDRLQWQQLDLNKLKNQNDALKATLCTISQTIGEGND